MAQLSPVLRAVARLMGWANYVLAGLCLWGAASPTEEQQGWETIRGQLIERLLEQDLLPIAFPVVKYQADLPANARYERDTIFVGQLQAAYYLAGDSLSILYHEYQHLLQEQAGHFALCLDSSGQIPQWQTEQWYEYQPDSLELAAEYAQALQTPWMRALSPERQRQELARLKRDLSQPRRILFVYAPSDLALAEIEAYQQQLAGAEIGLYVLSKEAKTSINRRLRQLADTYARRIRYEETHQLRSDGCPGSN